ncbi:MAG: hypothetical protein ACXAAH_03575 [Promethearchaeota archaeon]
MRSGKSIVKRPRCESCGARIYLSSKPFTNYFWGDTPSHCSRCGKQISNYNQKHLNEHDECIWLSLCCISIIFLIVVFIIFLR